MKIKKIKITKKIKQKSKQKIQILDFFAIVFGFFCDLFGFL